MSVFNPLTSNYTTRLFSSIGKTLYLNSELADVHFVFRSNDYNERVPAHKILFKAASDVFATMFNRTWKEKDEAKITDISAAAFNDFLQFFYFGQVKLTMDNVAAVMNLAEKYNVDECLAVCCKFVKNNLNDDNVLRYYELALLLDQEDLKQSCEIVIGLNANAMFNTSGFLVCDKKVLAEILKLDWLACTEVELFEACMAWVKAASKINVLSKKLVQTRLGDPFYDIRFGSMQFQEFSSLVPTYGIFFTGDEYADIIQIISDEEFEANMFNGNREKRCDSKPWHDKFGMYCDRLLSYNNLTEPYFIKDVETTKFHVNQPLLLISFTLNSIKKCHNGKYFHCDEIPTEINIVEVSSSDDAKKEVVRYNGKSHLNNLDCKIHIEKPILIRPGFMYEIRLKQNPPENCAIGQLLKSKVEVCYGITIQFHGDPSIPQIVHQLV